jgi:UDP-N-acetylenolpyruvoylglucosamine reductase
MKKIVLHFNDGYKMDVSDNLESINLIENIDSFYDNLIIERLNDLEYRLSGFQQEYQILNIQTKELYNNTKQSGVVKVSMQLEEEEFQHILKTIKRKENDSNN